MTNLNSLLVNNRFTLWNKSNMAMTEKLWKNVYHSMPENRQKKLVSRKISNSNKDKNKDRNRK